MRMQCVRDIFLLPGIISTRYESTRLAEPSIITRLLLLYSYTYTARYVLYSWLYSLFILCVNALHSIFHASWPYSQDYLPRGEVPALRVSVSKGTPWRVGLQ